MNEIINNIIEAERGGLLDLGKALRLLMLGEGIGGGGSGQGAAALSEFRAGVIVDKYISPSVYFSGHSAYTLTDSAIITPNFDFGINFLLTIAGDRILANPINSKTGQQGIFIIQQDSVGGHTLTWGSSYKFLIDSSPSLPQAAHAWTLVRYFVQTPSSIRCTIEDTGGTALNVATVGELWLGLESLKYISPAVFVEAEVPVALVDEAPVFVDLGEGKNFTLTLTANRTVDSPLDQMPGRWGWITVYQDGVGGRTLGWHADWKPAGGITPSIRSAAGAATTFKYRVLGVGNVLLEKEPEASTLPDVWLGTAQDKFISPYSAFEAMADVTLTDGATIIPNLDAGLTFALTIGGNRHISNPIGQRRGKQGRFYIQQDATGGWAVTWDTDFDFVGGVVPTIPIAPNAWTVVPFEVRSPGNIIAAAVEAYAGSGEGEVLPASVAEVRSASAISKYVSPSALSGLWTPYALPNTATVTPDMDLGVNFILTLQQNVLVANMANQRPGSGGFFIIVQGGAGGFAATWDTNYTFTGGVPPIASVAGSWIMVPYEVQAFGIIRCITLQYGAIPVAATASDIWTGAEAGKFIVPSIALASRAVVTLTDAAIIAVDLNTGSNFRVTLAGNRAMQNPTNQIAGKEGFIKIKQDGVGGRTLTWGDNYIFEGDPPTLPTDPDAHLVVPYHVEAVGTVMIG